ncbi:hypothetical protein PENSPDRAFT_693874 [Peniophora sp. CONT]|nr:hypothetical protein PENSPDRAFT_693874 [Peniophora sp. CONT]
MSEMMCAEAVLRENGAWQRQPYEAIDAGRASLCELDPSINDEQLDAVSYSYHHEQTINPLSGVQSVQRLLSSASFIIHCTPTHARSPRILSTTLNHLLLKEGPLPPRGTPKFCLPEMPRPAFVAPALAPKAPAPAPTVSVVTTLPNGMGSPGASPSLSSASSVKKGEGLRAPWNHSESIAKERVVVDELPKPARCATMAAI